MKKLLLSALGIGTGLAYSYYRGYWDGFEKARETHGPKDPSELDRYNTSEDEENEDAETSEKDDSEQITEATDKEIVDEVEEQSRVECSDDDCTDTFETEQGMKIHYGRVHKNSEEDN